MLKNHLKIALRSAIKQKGYTVINLFGLVIGLASFIIIMLYVYDELSYDEFHTDADRIHRVVFGQQNEAVTKSRVHSPGPMKNALVSEIPEIEEATNLMGPYWGKVNLANEKFTYYDNNFLFVDNSFLNFFSFSFVKGDPQSALNDSATIILTESAAQKFFGSEEALGKTLIYNQNTPLKITGIIKDVPSQSHLQFDFLVPNSLANRPSWETDWNQMSHFTYFKVGPQAEIQSINTKIQNLVEAHLESGSNETQENYFSQPLTAIHFSTYNNELAPSGSRFYVQMLSLVALFILLIAGINYINLATAKSAKRAKEIGLRKVVGVLRKTLIYQFIAESILTVFIAGILAIVLILALEPAFNDLMQKKLSLLSTESLPIWGFIVVTIIIFGLAAGLYPAFYLSGVKTISALKNKTTSGNKNINLRKGLVVLQFSLSAFLLVGMLVVKRQISYIQSVDLGFEKDQMIVIENFGRTPNRDLNRVVRATLETIPGVAQVGAFNEMVGLQDFSSETQISIKGLDNKESALWTNIGYGFLESTGIEIIDGRDFSPEFESDSTRNVVIINEKAIQSLNVKESAIGRQIVLSGRPPLTIVGVVKDFHFTSLHHEVRPFVFGWTPYANTAVVKISSNQMKGTISKIEDIWKSFVPDIPMDYYFFDEALENQYRSEQNFNTIFSFMTALIIVIACLGLFGLATHSSEQRFKEIGIRKTLGASVKSLVLLLSKEFIVLVLIGNIIAFPIAWFAMNKWLENFAYKTEFGVSVFALAGILALLIAGIAVGWQTIRAAVADPVKSLRTE